MIEILKSHGTEDKTYPLLLKSIAHQFRVGKVTSEAVLIKRGLWQGCVLSLLLFKIYSKTTFREELNEETRKIKLNGYVINVISYHDNTVVFASSLSELQHMI